MTAKSKASDNLWLELMKNEISLHGESSRKKWKVGNSRESECVLCNDFGGGALIRCSSEKCGKYFHLDCAFNHGGLSLQENGVLTCECDAHNKPILFCSCKQKYDNTKPMVFCDECCDWFHESCEKLKAVDIDDMETYTCLSCSEILKNGKSISKTLKEKNLEKDHKSTCNNNATKIVGILVELSGGACPIIDSVFGIGEDPLKISEAEDVISYLLNPPYVAKSENGEGDEDFKFLQVLGVDKLCNSWLQDVQNFILTWNSWKKRFESLCTSVVNKLNMSIDNNFHDIITKVMEELMAIELSRQNDFKFVSQSDFDEYAVVFESLKWLQDFVQALFTKSKSENWTHHLSTLVRTVQTKTKKINTVCKSAYAQPFARWYVQLIQQSSDLVSKMVSWHNQTCKVLNQEAEFPISVIAELSNNAKDFPSIPPLAAELNEHLKKCEALDNKFKQFLENAEFNEQALQAIDEEKNTLLVFLTLENVLTDVNSRAIFLKAYHLAIGEGRIQLAVAQSLLAKADKLKSDATSPLLLSLDKQIQDAVTMLSSKINEAMAIIQEINLKDFDGSKPEENEAFANLKQLLIITPEEELLQFLKDVGEMIATSKKILSNEYAISLQELIALAENLSNAHMNRVVDSFPQGQARKAEIRRILSSILDLQTSAQKQWSQVSNALNDLNHGVSVTYEVLSEFFDAAVKTSVQNESVHQAAVDLLCRGQELDAQYSESLAAIQDISKASADKLHELLETAKHCPLTATTAAHIRLRHETWVTVLSCQEILSNAATNVVEVLEEKTLFHTRELRNHIHRLESKITQENAIEANAIQLIKIPFLLYQWRHEVKHVIHSTTASSLHHAEKLQALAENISMEVVSSTQEWGDLLQMIATCKEFSESIHQLTASVDSVLADISEEVDSVDEGTVTNVERLFGIKFTGVWKIWNEKAPGILARSNTLHLQLQTLKVVQDESIMEINDTHGLVSAIDHSIHFIVSMNNVDVTSTFPTTSREIKNMTPLLDVKDIIAFMNKLAILKEKHSKYWIVLKLADCMNAIYFAANQWMEKYSAIIPTKVTRNKNRADMKLAKKENLLTALSEPMSRLIATPLQEKFVSVLSEAEELHTVLLNFVMPPKNIYDPKHLEANLNTVLQEDIIKLSGIKQIADIIPLDLPDTYVLQWALDVLLWSMNIPRPNISSEQQVAISIDTARQKMKDAAPIICELPSYLVHYLADLGMMNLDPSKGPIGFHEHAHPILKRAGEYYDFLEKQVTKCVEYEQAIDEAYEMDASRAKLKQLYESMKELLVVPDPNVKRTLEKLINARSVADSDQKSGSGIVTKSGRTSKKKYNDDYYFDSSMDLTAPVTPPSSTTASNIKIPTVGDFAIPKHLTAAGAADRPRLLKKPKFAKCAAQGCTKEVKHPSQSSFCGNACACKSGLEMMQSVVKYKSYIDKYNQAVKANRTISAQQLLDFHKLRQEDILAWELEDLSLANNHSMDSTDPKNVVAAKKVTAIQAIQVKLPKISANIIALDHEDSVTNTSMNRYSKYLEPVDIMMRMKARSLLEELFISVLQKIQPEGGLAMGALLGLELEEGLFLKYLNKSSETPFDKREYRKHYLMFMHNLKQAHNENLIQKLVRCELTVEQLLAMSAQNFADSSTQLLRQKQLHSVVEDARKKSSEEENEEKRRQAMAGQAEAWRSGGSSVVDEIAPSLSTKIESSTHANPDFAIDTDIDNINPDGSIEIMPISPRSPKLMTKSDDPEKPSDRSLEIEQKVLLSQMGKTGSSSSIETSSTSAPPRAPKRSIDADAMTRFVTTSNVGKPMKIARLDSDDYMDMDDKESHRTTPLESPKHKAPPSLLEILKQCQVGGSADSHDDTNNNHTNNNSNNKSKAATSPEYSMYIPTMRLVNKDGNEIFTITRPGGVVMKVSAMVNDKRVQGVVKSTFNIDGRTRIGELEKFVNELITANRKIVATVTFLVGHVSMNDPNNSYHKFCEEFTKDERAGISNSSETGVQVYIIPPALKAQISILKGLQPDNTAMMQNQGLLFGLIVSKSSGPKDLIHRHQSTIPFAINCFAFIPPLTNEDAAIAAGKPTPTPAILTSSTNPVQGTMKAGVTAPSSIIAPTLRTGPTPVVAPVLAPIGFQAPATVLPMVPPPQGSIAAFTQAIAANRPIMGSMIPPVAPVIAPPIIIQQPKLQPLTQVDRDRIRQVAEFCAKKGVAKLQSLKENPESKTLMPFLFEGNPGYEEFMHTIKEIVGLAGPSPAQGPPPINIAPMQQSQQQPMKQPLLSPGHQHQLQQNRSGGGYPPHDHQSPYQHQQQSPSSHFGERKSRFSK